MKLPVNPLLRAIWRASRDAQDRGGLHVDEVERLCGAEKGSYAVRARLAQMVSRDYLMKLGDKHSPRWVIGLNVPEGESSDVGAPTVASKSLLARPFAELETEAFTQRLGGTPCSVWQMAILIGAQP